MRPGMLETEISGARKKTSHAHVVDALGKEIICGRYPVGSVLPGDVELAARFQVSRTVLREAMKTLAAKGLVIPRARIGTRVTLKNQWNLFDADILSWHFHSGIDEQFLIALSEMRLAFEPFAAGLAARNASAEQIEGLYVAAAEMARDEHTAESLSRADLKFHLGILEASGNPFMRSVGSLIEAALVGVFKLSSPAALGNRIGDVAASHRKIVDAIAGRDEPGAIEAMRRVIISGREHVKSRLSGSGS